MCIKFNNLHNSLSDIIKKLMKSSSKDRVLKWMRHAIDLNYEKEKTISHKLVASNGFFLNYIEVLLILCKPFTGNFNKYGNFISKVSSFYMFQNNLHKSNEKFECIDNR